MKLTNELCDELFKELDIDTKRNLIALASELKEAVKKHPIWPICKHYHPKSKAQNFPKAALIVMEEAGELARATLRYQDEKLGYYNMHREAIQIGAMVIRFLNSAPEMPNS